MTKQMRQKKAQAFEQRVLEGLRSCKGMAKCGHIVVYTTKHTGRLIERILTCHTKLCPSCWRAKHESPSVTGAA